MSSKGNSGSRSSMFLVELIITILFFSLASVVCVRLFLYAHKISSDSQVQTEAVTLAQNAAESFLAADGNIDQFGEFMSAVLNFSISEMDSAEMDAAEIHDWLDAAETKDSFSPKYGHIEKIYMLSLNGSWEPVMSDQADDARYLAAFVISSEPQDKGAMHALNVRICDTLNTEIYALEVLDYVQ